MRKNLYFAFFVLILFSFSSCNLSDDDDSRDEPQSGMLKFKVDGNQYTSNDASGAIQLLFGSKIFNVLANTIEGRPGEFFLLTFAIYEDEELTTQTYSICDGNKDKNCVNLSNSSLISVSAEKIFSASADNSGEASATFDFLDYQAGGKASGTFSGIAIDGNGNERIITDGEFDVTILE